MTEQELKEKGLNGSCGYMDKNTKEILPHCSHYCAWCGQGVDVSDTLLFEKDNTLGMFYNSKWYDYNCDCGINFWIRINEEKINVKKFTNKDDICKKCGNIGEIKGMCCKCNNCNNVIWGI